MNNFGKDKIRELLVQGKPFNEIMTDIMKIGSEIVKETGNKDYKSFEEAMLDIKNHTGPMFVIDDDVTTDFEDVGTNLIAVKTCPMKKIMKEMSESGTSDADVDTVMDNHQVGDNSIESNFSDIGCYIAQQIRQMVISSLTINGKYLMNYIHLGCNKHGKINHNVDDQANVGVDKEMIERLLQNHDCAYVISFKEGMK